MGETHPFEEESTRGIGIPARLDDILIEHATRNGIPRNTLARHYIINGLQAEGVEVTPEDIVQIEEETERLRQESSHTEPFDHFVQE